jgi:hypothetical protein
MVWETAEGKPLLTLRPQNHQIWAVAISPDGQRIATGGDGKVKVWELATGKELLTLNGHRGPVSGVAFSPDGRRIVSGSNDKMAKVWDAGTGLELLGLKGHRDRVVCAAFSTNGRRIVTGSDDQTVRVWDAVNGKELLALKGHGDSILFCKFSRDGQQIFSGSSDQTARVWEAATIQQVAAFERQTAAQHEQVEGEKRERALRAQDPGAIKQWLVLAPIPFDVVGQTGSGAAALAQEQIPNEANLQPRAGDRVMAAQRELVWTAAQLPDYLIDFNDLLGKATFQSVAYAVCYIQSETPQTGLLLKVGSDDQAKIYLNGKETYRSDATRSWVSDQDTVEGIELKAGLNALVFKVVNEGQDWQGSIRFTDAAGQPVKGILVTLTPP